MQSRIVILTVILLLLLSCRVQAGLLFFSDFEDPGKTEAFPNDSVNDIKNWKSSNKAQNWEIIKGPNGTNAIMQTIEGEAANGETLLPDPNGRNEQWTDVIIEFEASWRDDDAHEVLFRRSAPKQGYCAIFGASQEHFVALLDVSLDCYTVDGVKIREACLGQFIEKIDHDIVVDETGATIYSIRVEAIGDTIKLYFAEEGEIDLGDPIIEVKDSTYKRGTVGFRPGSLPNSAIDNIRVTTPPGKAVKTAGKLTTTWGSIKEE
jgi:hypothetical protein